MERNEIQEYNEFLAKAVLKSRELMDDYNKLSPNNKNRFIRELSHNAELHILIEFLKSM